jgi:hypothetical protein
VNKKAVAKVLSNLPGFRTLGPYYIGTCNRDVLSGYALDAPPGGVYISRFILPAYDRIDFLHMALGKRIAQFSGNEAASDSTGLHLLLKNDWRLFSDARDCQSLLAYLDREQVEGDYYQWTRYLTYVRVRDIESASRMELQFQVFPGFPRVQLVAENMKAVLEVKERSGWDGVQALLTEWSEHTVAKFCR